MENQDQYFPKIKGEFMLTKKGVFKLIALSGKFLQIEVFRTTNGFISTYVLNDGTESFLYKSEDEIKEHFKKFNNSNLWKNHFEIMSENLIVRMHLLKDGSISRKIILEEFEKLKL